MALNFQNDFYVVRHGKAKNNELGIESCKMETQEVYGLTSEGRESLAKEAEHRKDFDLIFSSPFRRTQETAAYFAETSQCKVILDDRLVDIDLGDLDLKQYELSDAVAEEHPEHDYVYPNGESLSHGLKRLMSFMDEVNGKYKGKKILIVSHGWPCETLLDWAMGNSLRHWEECIEKGKVFSLTTSL